jgi:hypothetical protein
VKVGAHTVASVLGLAAIIVGIGFAPMWAVASDLSQGQLVVAFEPQLTGDAARDFVRAVGTNDTFTVYVIAGPLLAPSRAFSFGLGISEGANIAVNEVRSFWFAEVSADQIDAVVSVFVTVHPRCFDLGSQAVLAEVDLVRVGREIPVQIQLGSFLFGLSQPPALESCQGVVMFFDDSVAPPLSVEAPAPVPVSRPSWAAVKNLYRLP